MRYIFLLLFLTACSSTPTTWREVGHLKDMDEIPTSFNDSQRQKITTQEGDIFFIGCITSGKIGDVVYLSDSGYLSIGDQKVSCLVYGH